MKTNVKSVSPAATVRRALPVVVVPLGVAIFQPHVHDVPVMVVGVLVGGIIAAAVSRMVFSLLASMVAIGVLLSASHMHELHLAEHLQHMEDSVRPQVAHRLGVPRAYTNARTAAFAPVPLAQSLLGATFSGIGLRGGVDGVRARPREAMEMAPPRMETMSVVLPCAFEGNYAVKTVEAIWGRSNQSRIREIVVVDDGSTPPLRTEFPEHLLSGRPGVAPVVMVRHEKTLGLINAKKTGGDHAVGDVIVFLDCHVSPREGWEEAILRQMKRAGDHKTVVVPVITSLDPDSWQEIDPTAKPRGMGCYFTWNADFTWLTLEEDNAVPIMSGGLLALSRRWWQETGGYDSKMVAWGGENIDQSIRTWLCGGRIELAPDSFVAHMWRDSSNPKTRLKYPMPTEDVMRNKARAVKAWFGPFAEKTWTFPEYGMFIRKEQEIGGMEEFDEVKQRLQCEPFLFFLKRFSYVYEDSGFLPEQVFQLRDEKSGLCLERQSHHGARKGGSIIMSPCTGEAGASASVTAAGSIAELQIWHPASRNVSNDKKCCSSLTNWNFNLCLDAPTIGVPVGVFECDIEGVNNAQHFELNEESGQLLWQNGNGCVGIRHGSTVASRYVPSNDCTAKHDAVKGGKTFKLGDHIVPKFFKLRSTALKSMVNGSCAAVGASPRADNEPGKVLVFESCDDDLPSQVFHAKPLFEGLQIQVGGASLCLDSAGGDSLLAYPCYDDTVHNLNQLWKFGPNGQLCWHGSPNDKCIDLVDEPKRESSVTIATCSPKQGQVFQRDFSGGSLPKGKFLLRDPFTKRCLGGADFADSAIQTNLGLFECGPEHVWQELKERQMIMYVKRNMCIDMADGTPILYSCHTGETGVPQRWRYDEPPGFIRTFESWSDNGRTRVFSQCLDMSPVEPSHAVTIDCEATRKQGIRWKKVGIQKPLERRIFERATANERADSEAILLA
eukprot:TRINITY_DN68220_c0_g1_i1.p1 TRINITY_DN68220_c0_g1~~TRINITY_DN68220_c0_g1_i1.p1  ORF type:complete len:949 (+),score=144.22 TRINITY_DN68220_c0_g1_i1:268-3114(+)